MRLIGFSHGVAYRLIDPYCEEQINRFIACGCDAIEVNWHFLTDEEKVRTIEPFLDSFAYRSIHLPCDTRYADDEATHRLLASIASYYRDIGASLAVLHPDLIDDAMAFERYPDIQWAIENMDDRKKRYRTVEDMKDFFDRYPKWKFVLDVGHCNANDKTMRLADDFIRELGSRVAEIHLSGYETFHDPLYRTKQVEIIERCKRLDAPVIIESTFESLDGMEGVAKEFAYVSGILRT